MEYRVENKYVVTDAELALLGARLRNILPLDAHQDGDCYEIRSIYLDDEWDRCMDENGAGISQREKYRIRTYNPASDVIHLEIKGKQGGLTHKDACSLTHQEVEEILCGTLPLQLDERKPLNRLQMEMRCSNMRPKAIIAYERTAFVYPDGNVRITFDRNIMASRCCEDFFSPRITGLCPVLPTATHVLEVKYDEFLPEFIASQLEIGTLQHTSFSKYYLGRLALLGEFPKER